MRDIVQALKGVVNTLRAGNMQSKQSSKSKGMMMHAVRISMREELYGSTDNLTNNSESDTFHIHW